MWVRLGFFWFGVGKRDIPRSKRLGGESVVRDQLYFRRNLPSTLEHDFQLRFELLIFPLDMLGHTFVPSLGRLLRGHTRRSQVRRQSHHRIGEVEVVALAQRVIVVEGRRPRLVSASLVAGVVVERLSVGRARRCVTVGRNNIVIRVLRLGQRVVTVVRPGCSGERHFNVRCQVLPHCVITHQLVAVWLGLVAGLRLPRDYLGRELRPPGAGGGGSLAGGSLEGTRVSRLRVDLGRLVDFEEHPRVPRILRVGDADTVADVE